MLEWTRLQSFPLHKKKIGEGGGMVGGGGSKWNFENENWVFQKAIFNLRKSTFDFDFSIRKSTLKLEFSIRKSIIDI